MNGKIAIGQLPPFSLVGYFGAPPICRGIFTPNTNLFISKQKSFQPLGKTESFLRIGPLNALSVADTGSGKRSASYMNNGADVTEVRLWL
jgi:hypothetical protein